jgi:nitronate monooxygenase
MNRLLYTPLCERLQIDLPIIQAPIGSASCPALAAAVSNSGGLGMLALSWRTPEVTRQMIRQTRKLTARPFGVNLVLEWEQQERLNICLQEGVKVVSFSWGDPSAYLDAVHSADAIALQTIGSAVQARRAVDSGVDVIVAQGWEAGGHVLSEVATMVLVPCVVDAVTPSPVVAAGGIADGRGLAAALALGASGVFVGTRFLLSYEAEVHEIYRQELLNATETDTILSEVFDIGWPNAPHRTIQNSTVKLWESAGKPPTGHRPKEGEVIALLGDASPILRYSDVIPMPGMNGDLEGLALYAGQSTGLVPQLQSASEIVADLAERAIQVLRQLARGGP